jgi:hypothetical protein
MSAMEDHHTVVPDSAEPVRKLQQVATEYIAALETSLNAVRAYQSRRDECRRCCIHYQSVRDELVSIRNEAAKVIQAAIAAGSAEPFDLFRQQYEEISSISRQVCSKENEVCAELAIVRLVRDGDDYYDC